MRPETIVTTPYGQIEGFLENESIKFLGIPYAKPPVGKLRFKRAVAMEPWEGVFSAKQFGEPAVQCRDGEKMGSEDCLTLNVIRPQHGTQLPVVVWIHGGGYNTGAASDELCDGEQFSADGIVYVSIQYRMNVLGFYDFTTYKGCETMDKESK